MAKLTILGSNSALPAHQRHPSAQYLQLGKDHMLIDCGDGTQFRCYHFGVSLLKINYIFISHLHGDHVFGLPGVLTSMLLLSRTQPLTVFGPKGIQAMMTHYLESSYFTPSYPLYFVETDPAKVMRVVDTPTLSVDTIPLRHKIPCNGYLFRTHLTQLNIKKELIQTHQLSVGQIKALKDGANVETPQGLLTPEEALYVKSSPKSYAYCSDTIYLPQLADQIRGVDLLYHEATYLDEWADKSVERGHSTAKQAGLIAQSAGVKKLIIGHPSSKYKFIDTLLSEAQSVFPNTAFAFEGMCIEI